MATKRKYNDITETVFGEDLNDDIKYLLNKYDITFNNYHEYIDLIVDNFKNLFNSEKECIDHIMYFIYLQVR
jgi:hypothetical protein